MASPRLHALQIAPDPEQAAGAGPQKPAPATDVQRREVARLRRIDARVATKRELTGVLHSYGISSGQLARWLGCSPQHAQRVLSELHPDVNLAYGDRLLLPLEIQRALAHGETQRLSGQRPAASADPVRLAHAGVFAASDALKAAHEAMADDVLTDAERRDLAARGRALREVAERLEQLGLT